MDATTRPVEAPPAALHVASTRDWSLESARWVGWRLRVLVAAALVGCLGLFLLMRLLVGEPVVDGRLGLLADGSGLSLATGRAEPVPVVGVRHRDGAVTPVDALLLQRSARWIASDRLRARFLAQHDALASALEAGVVHWVSADGSPLDTEVHPRGVRGLGWAFWGYSAAALLLYLVTLVVLLARPVARNGLYAVMALSLVGSLVLLAVESVGAPGWPTGSMASELVVRTALDLAAGAALVHITAIHPLRLARAALHGGVAWFVATTVLWGVTQDHWAGGWWWIQGTLLANGAVAIAQMAAMQRQRLHPLANQLLRYGTIAMTMLFVLTLTTAAVDLRGAGQAVAGPIAGQVWTLFVAALLLLVPFLSSAQQLLREFSLVAGVSTVATSLDLLFVSVFSFSSFASLTLALFVALAAYAGARQWLMSRLVQRERLTTERMFEHLYRMAREVQTRPSEAGVRLSVLLRELFDPLHVQAAPGPVAHSRVTAEGANLSVPIPGVAGAPASTLTLAFADRGRRLFTDDDAQLADRIVDLVARSMAIDQAVERGRSEERQRIAQDLHDDIGARLLTLMYRAPTREMEDYLRHTLKDLKTLTRGLAASSHWLSHAVAEWKADIAHRLAAADCELGWTFTYAEDFELSVVQWSALTRILRELVSNAMAHARASRVDIEASIHDGVLNLRVSDNGHGSDPAAWAHGLGIGGVRKRVKQLGGAVHWSLGERGGVTCVVVVPHFGVPGLERTTGRTLA